MDTTNYQRNKILSELKGLLKSIGFVSQRITPLTKELLKLKDAEGRTRLDSLKSGKHIFL